MKGIVALSPVAVFLAVHLVSSLVAGDFYKVPVSAAFLVASVYVVAVARAGGIEERMAIFSSGAANSNVLMMVWIFVLAGAFASSAKEIGSIDAAVNLALGLSAVAVICIFPSRGI